MGQHSVLTPMESPDVRNAVCTLYTCTAGMMCLLVYTHGDIAHFIFHRSRCLVSAVLLSWPVHIEGLLFGLDYVEHRPLSSQQPFLWRCSSTSTWVRCPLMRRQCMAQTVLPVQRRCFRCHKAAAHRIPTIHTPIGTGRSPPPPP